MGKNKIPDVYKEPTQCGGVIKKDGKWWGRGVWGSMGLGRIRIIAEVFRGRGSAKKWPLLIGEGLRYWGYHWSKLLTLTLIKNIDIDIEEKQKLTLTLTLRQVNYHESTLTLVLTLRFEKHWHWIEHWHWPLKTIDIDIALKISTLLMSGLYSRFWNLNTRGPSLFCNLNPKLAVLAFWRGQMAKIRPFFLCIWGGNCILKVALFCILGPFRAVKVI